MFTSFTTSSNEVMYFTTHLNRAVKNIDRGSSVVLAAVTMLALAIASTVRHIVEHELAVVPSD